nr:uncharacterized protein LOC129008559 [Pongo pygmaeus]XP_054296919.1 uncharacterized protein LOC129008559 [Pongo pygmaeus]XP_054296920.1 uncharacterized protein LOC129008559 [Pongo pygmaeus]XP_054296921.1 uncharacterized protein LOC129008559 [Pongo pygmaeus]XP_054296922.1 uncharacterized protein LOC129008559 [Pongo pygmaeus]XP_054296923.1 uncharacterized protein LOC129008559 [Pongo pygmaeus]
MSKRPKDTPVNTSDKKKRKHLCLSIAQKVKLLEKLDSGVSVKHLTEEYGVGMTTIYDLKKQKDKLLKFYAESDEQILMKNRKTLHKAKNEDLDRVLKDWIRQRRSEHMPLNGMLIMKQAKIYHNELKIEGNCEYSTGWLQKFKKRHGIKFLKICGNKASAGHEAAEKFTGKFSDGDEQDGNFEGFYMSSEKKIMSDLLTYTKNIHPETVSKLEEEDIKDVFNSNNEASVVHSLSNGEVTKMVLNQDDHDNNDNEDDVNTAEKVPIDEMVKMCDGLIKGLEQHAFITEQEIMSVYKIKERLLRQKASLMRQMTLKETFKKAIQRNASSSLQDPLLGPSTASDAASHLKIK